MRFLLGWTVRLGFWAVAYLTITGKLQPTLPETVMGYEVPPMVRQWVGSDVEIIRYGQQTQDGFRQISDSLR